MLCNTVRPLDSILTLMTVWRITGKIIRTLPLLSHMHIQMESSYNFKFKFSSCLCSVFAYRLNFVFH